MKLQIITTAALLTLSSTLGLSNLRADDTPPPPPAGEHPGRGPGRGMSVEQRLTQIAEAISLTDAQKEKLKPIIKAEIEEMRTVMQNDSLDRAARREKMKAIRETYKPKIRAELTAEQVAKLDAWEKDHPGMRGPGGPKGEHKGPPPTNE